jgi:hypothetical protein
VQTKSVLGFLRLEGTTRLAIDPIDRAMERSSARPPGAERGMCGLAWARGLLALSAQPQPSWPSLASAVGPGMAGIPGACDTRPTQLGARRIADPAGCAAQG